MKFAILTTATLIVASISGCGDRFSFSTECDWAQPIRPSPADVLTRGTKEQIVAHNEDGAKQCGWKP